MVPEVKAQLKEKAQDFVFKKANVILIDTVLPTKEIINFMEQNGYLFDRVDQYSGKIISKQFNVFEHFSPTGYMEILPEKDYILITGYTLALFGESEYRMENRPITSNQGKLFKVINEFAMKMGKVYGVKVLYLKL